jgi:hypothetical protein
MQAGCSLLLLLLLLLLQLWQDVRTYRHQLLLESEQLQRSMKQHPTHGAGRSALELLLQCMGGLLLLGQPLPLLLLLGQPPPLLLPLPLGPPAWLHTRLQQQA